MEYSGQKIKWKNISVFWLVLSERKRIEGLILRQAQDKFFAQLRIYSSGTAPE